MACDAFERLRAIRGDDDRKVWEIEGGLREILKSAAVDGRDDLLRYLERRVEQQLANALADPNADDNQLNGAAWPIVAAPDSDSDQYRDALNCAIRAVRLNPADYNVATLGVAQYRVGMYADAMATFRNADRQPPPALRSNPWDLAIIAMAQKGLGDVGYRDTMEILEKQMKDPRYRDNISTRSSRITEAFLREARSVCRD